MRQHMMDEGLATTAPTCMSAPYVAPYVPNGVAGNSITICSKCGLGYHGFHQCLTPKKDSTITVSVEIDVDEEKLDRLIEKLERLADLRESAGL